MRHLKKFNESSEYQPYTWDELVYSIDEGELDYVRCNREDVRNYITNMIASYLDPSKKWHNPDKNTSPISEGKCLLTEIGPYVLVFNNDGVPMAFISEYEMMNPFVFGDIAIIPGRDSITCYNIKTREHKREHIR